MSSVYGFGTVALLIYIGVAALGVFVSYLIIKTAVKNGIRDSVLPEALRRAQQHGSPAVPIGTETSPVQNAGFVPIQTPPVSNAASRTAHAQPTCPACGGINNPEAGFCRYCGNSLR